MKLEVLVSSMNKDPKILVENMNINTDAIIINQCEKNLYEEFQYNNHTIRVFHFNERGIGLSRNNALLRARGDILLLADEDEVLCDNYDEIILNQFIDDRDFVVFNIKGLSVNRKIYQIKKIRRVRKYNSLRYGAVRMAFRLDFVRKNNIFFSLLFGGGTKFGSGEDSIFIYDCLKKGAKVYSCPEVIANVDFSESTWFNGYNEKFFYDKGALLYQLHRNMSPLFIFIYLFRHSYMYKKIGFRNAMHSMWEGYQEIKTWGSR